MHYTTRQYPRSMREAFRDWPENCYGVEFPPSVPTRPSVWVRIATWLARWA